MLYSDEITPNCHREGQKRRSGCTDREDPPHGSPAGPLHCQVPAGEGRRIRIPSSFPGQQSVWGPNGPLFPEKGPSHLASIKVTRPISKPGTWCPPLLSWGRGNGHVGHRVSPLRPHAQTRHCKEESRACSNSSRAPTGCGTSAEQTVVPLRAPFPSCGCHRGELQGPVTVALNNPLPPCKPFPLSVTLRASYRHTSVTDEAALKPRPVGPVGPLPGPRGSAGSHAPWSRYQAPPW